MYALFDDQRMLQYMQFGQTNAPLQDGVAIDMFGIRFEEVLNAPVIGSAHDSIVLADEAYAITKLQGEGNVRVITKGLGSAGVEDTLDQRQSIGYKITGFATKVLRPESVVNYWSNPVVAGSEITAGTITPAAAAEIVGLIQVNFSEAGGAAESVVVGYESTLAQAFALVQNATIAADTTFTVGGSTVSGALRVKNLLTLAAVDAPAPVAGDILQLAVVTS